MADFLKKIKALTLQEYEALPYSERVRTDVLYFTRDTDTGELTPVTDPKLYEAVLLVDQNGEPLQDQDGRYIVPEDVDIYARELSLQADAKADEALGGLDGKLDKLPPHINGYANAYIVASNGNQELRALVPNIAAGNSIVIRNSNGTIVATDAVNPNEVVTKAQLDAASGGSGEVWVEQNLNDYSVYDDISTHAYEFPNEGTFRVTYGIFLINEYLVGDDTYQEWVLSLTKQFIFSVEEIPVALENAYYGSIIDDKIFYHNQSEEIGGALSLNRGYGETTVRISAADFMAGLENYMPPLIKIEKLEEN